MRQFYNLVFHLDKEGRDDSIASELTRFALYVKNFRIASFYSKLTNATTKKTKDSKNSGGKPASSGNHESELITHGYKAKVEVESEAEDFTPLFQVRLSIPRYIKYAIS